MSFLILAKITIQRENVKLAYNYIYLSYWKVLSERYNGQE